MDIDVEMLNNNVILRGSVRNIEEFEFVKRVLLPVLQEASIDFSQIRMVGAKNTRFLFAEAFGEVRSRISLAGFPLRIAGHGPVRGYRRWCLPFSTGSGF